MMVAGASGLAVTAPLQAKDKAPAQPAGPKLSEPVRKPLAAAQTALAAKDYATVTTNLDAADAAAKTDEEKYYAGVIRLQSMQSQGQTAQAQPVIDALIGNPFTKPEEKARFLAARGNGAFNSKNYKQALADMTEAKRLGFSDPNVSLMIAQSKVETNDVAGGLAELDNVVATDKAAGRATTEDIYRYAVARANKSGDMQLTGTWLRRWVGAYPTAANWRDMILLYLQGNEKNLDKRQRIDVYRLMRATKSLADQRDYGDYAQLAYDSGLGAETKTVIDEGRAAGKVPASYAPTNELYNLSKARIDTPASLTALEKKAAAAATGADAAATGDAYLAAGNNAKAADLYKLALQKGSVKADEVNTHLGIALARSGDKAGAKAAFAAVPAGPRHDIASYWMFYLDSPIAA